MNYLIIDDEQIILMGMEMTLRDVVGQDAVIYTASNPFTALEILKSNSIDIVFSDVDMPGMNGLKLAEEIQKINEEIEIVFATGYAHYSLDAWKTAAEAFVLKPVSEEDIRSVLSKIERKRRRKEKHSAKGDEGNGSDIISSSQAETLIDIKAMCFGNFEILYKDRPIHFARRKSKELIAYLIDRRGAMITTDEIRSILWEEEADTEEKKGYVRVLANDIRKSFDALGIESILINDQNRYSVDITRISCDYIDFMNGDEKAKRLFQDEYMVQYSWAEATLGRLLNMT